MQTERLFQSTDRYVFDFDVCHFKKGWAQLDTAQDASYYGNWINPAERKLVSYCEGDLTIRTAADDAEFVAAVRETVAWHIENGGKAAIDPMCQDSIIAAFAALGLADLLH